MAIIKTAYPEYYRNQSDIADAITLWAEMFSNDDALLIARATKQFIKTDSKGFPPKIGQISTIAAEIRRMDWDRKQREQALLPTPEVKAVPMPDEIRQKIESWLRESK